MGSVPGKSNQQIDKRRAAEVDRQLAAVEVRIGRPRRAASPEATTPATTTSSGPATKAGKVTLVSVPRPIARAIPQVIQRRWKPSDLSRSSSESVASVTSRKSWRALWKRPTISGIVATRKIVSSRATQLLEDDPGDLAAEK